MPNNIIDKIRVSGTDYTLSATTSGVSVVEVTQAEYDALPSSAKTDTSKMYVITDAEAGDLTNYYTKTETNTLLGNKADTATTYTKTEVDNTITAATATKQDTLVSGTNIKTINNTSILGSGNIDIQGGGGGGKAIEAGRGISVTTGATADTVSFDLSISAGTGTGALVIASDTYRLADKATGNYAVSLNGGGVHPNYAKGANSLAEGSDTRAYSESCHAEGYGTKAGNPNNSSVGMFSHAEGYLTSATSEASHTEGFRTIANNYVEHASGKFNVSSSASTTFGDSGNTLFSVGNGTANNARHNAFEIRQNGDIYLSSGGTDIKLQDHLGGGGITSGDVQTMIDSSISGKVNSSDVYLKSETSGATEIATALSTKQDTLVSGTSIKTINNESILGSGNITIQGGGGEVSSAITSGDTNAVAGGAVFDAVVYSGSTYTTELTFDANGYAENWIVGQSAITIDVSGYTSNTSADYHFEDSNGLDLGRAHIFKVIGSWGGQWSNDANNCTITTDGDTATTATITDIPSGTVKIRRRSEMNPPKAIISGDTPEIWIKDALDDHRDNTTVHITAAERTSWNNKSNFSGSYNDLTDKPIPDSALNVASTNPVQNQALYNELRLSDGGEAETTLTFEGYNTTNYPQGCTKIKVEDITSYSSNNINFFADDGPVGSIAVSNWGSIAVDTSGFQGASYEISGSSVIISYPTVTTVVRLDVSNSTKYTYKAITSSTTPLKDQVVANTTALGGLSLVKLTQQQYDALATKDSNTLYVIVN